MHITRKILATTSLILASSTAVAGPLADCVSTAEANHPTASYEVLQDNATFLSTGDLELFQQTVAQWHDQAAFGVSGNGAGAAAVAELLQCQWDNNAWTLSAAVLHEQLSLALNGFEIGFESAGDAVFIGATTTCSGAPALEYHRGDSVYLWEMAAEGSHDFVSATGTGGFEIPDYDGCAGVDCECLMECSPEGKTVCFCAVAGGQCITFTDLTHPVIADPN